MIADPPFPGLEISELVLEPQDCGALRPKEAQKISYAFDGKRMWAYLRATGDYAYGEDLDAALKDLWYGVGEYIMLLETRPLTDGQEYEKAIYERVFV